MNIYNPFTEKIEKLKEFESAEIEGREERAKSFSCMFKE